MPVLIVINGPPAVGKSTMARMYAHDHPMTLRIDVDEIRDLLGGWSQTRSAAGVRARALATAMARDHLRAGHDVVVAQLYGQPDHLDELAAAANELGVRYLEVVLMTDVTSTLERFTQRRGPRLEDALHAPKGLGTIVELHERVADLARAREHAKVVMSIPNDIAATYGALLEVTTDINPSTA